MPASLHFHSDNLEKRFLLRKIRSGGAPRLFIWSATGWSATGWSAMATKGCVLVAVHTVANRWQRDPPALVLCMTSDAFVGFDVLSGFRKARLKKAGNRVPVIAALVALQTDLAVNVLRPEADGRLSKPEPVVDVGANLLRCGALRSHMTFLAAEPLMTGVHGPLRNQAVPFRERKKPRHQRTNHNSGKQPDIPPVCQQCSDEGGSHRD